MDLPNAFTSLILSAHEVGPDPLTVTARTAYDHYTLAGAWAEHAGWEESYHCLTHRELGLTISGGDGALEVVDRDGRVDTYPTRSPEQTLGHLVNAQILPPAFSPAALALLEDVAAAHERMADHILTAHEGNAAMAAVASTWQAAADSARGYLEARQLELAVGGTLAAAA